MKLNITAKSKEQELIKTFLEDNANDVLADKINNGVKITKDGKTLINKKTLEGSIKFATDEARKQAAKNASSAMIEDKVVFGWAMHYFEEDSIEGTLYNEDGTVYKPVISKSKTSPSTVTSTYIPPIKKKEEAQYSLFDLFDKEGKATAPEQVEEEPEEVDEDEEIKEKTISTPEPMNKEPKPEVPQFYKEYTKTQAKYPNAIVCTQLGDFFEVYGENATIAANILGLILTGRNLGLEQRVPMCGFPYHTADNCFAKIIEQHDLVIVYNGKENYFPKAKTEDEEEPEVDQELMEEIDALPPDESKKIFYQNENEYVDEDGEVHTDNSALYAQLIELFENKAIVRK